MKGLCMIETYLKEQKNIEPDLHAKPEGLL